MVPSASEHWGTREEVGICLDALAEVLEALVLDAARVPGRRRQRYERHSLGSDGSPLVSVCRLAAAAGDRDATRAEREGAGAEDHPEPQPCVVTRACATARHGRLRRTRRTWSGTCPCGSPRRGPRAARRSGR